jgi:hypothetical protein
MEKKFVDLKSPSCLFRYGLPKYYAIVSSIALSCIYGFTAVLFLPDSIWANPLLFFVVFIICFGIIHNPTLDKPYETYVYKIISDKSFVDEKYMLDYINEEGSYGWELISIKASEARVETYHFLFKKKHYSLSDKPTFKWRVAKKR